MERELIIILPDIRSTYNTGSLFRTSDAVGVNKIFLTGFTAAPPHPHLVKVSLGAEKSVPWEYRADLNQLLDELRCDGYQIIALEQTSSSTDFRTAVYEKKVAIIFGNEVGGVAKNILEKADSIVHLPMVGKKESLNVAVAGGIILYYLRAF